MNTQHEDPRSVARVQLGAIRRDPRGWPRKELDTERVAEFLTIYLDEGFALLPLIEVVPDGDGGYIVGDGNHRFEAILKTDTEEIEVILLEIPEGMDFRDAAYELGLRSAASSPLRLTRAEKHAAIRHLKETRPELSERQIADLVAVSHQTVGRVLDRWSNGPQAQPSNDPGLDLLRGVAELDLARRFFRGMEKVRAARGLGLWDALTRDHTGDRLARVLSEACGAEALDRAEQYRAWIDEAIAALKKGGQ